MNRVQFRKYSFFSKRRKKKSTHRQDRKSPKTSPYQIASHPKERIGDLSLPVTPLSSGHRHRISRKSLTPNESEIFLPNTCIAHKGKIFFWKNSAYDCEGHPFVRVTQDSSITSVADMMHSDWQLGKPRIVLVVITNVTPLHHWKNQSQIQQFQKGFIKAANTTEMWVITHGLNIGAAKLIGEAVMSENQRRRALKCHKHPNTPGAHLPPLTLIGAPREDFLKHSYLLEHRDTHRVEIQNEGNLPEENKYELNPEHTHFLMVRDNTVNKTGINYFLLRLEQYLNSSPEMMTQLQDQEPGKSELLMYLEIPVVALLVQGGYNCSRMVLDHLKKQMPVVVLRGTGGLADLLAFAYHEVSQRPGKMNDQDFIENFLKPELANKIAYHFPMFRDNNLARNSFRDRVMGCVRYATQNQQTFLTVLNIHNHSCNLENLDKHLLKALFQCQRPQTNNWHIRMQKDLLLTLDWNSPEVAITEVFLKDPSSKFKIDKAVFEQALTHSDRQLFVAIFLEHGFQVHKYLTSYRLKQLFKKTSAQEFFYSVCWEGVLGYRPMSTVSKHFVDLDLNYLIYKLAGIPHFVEAHELNQNAMSLYEADASVAERKAITLLAMWAAFTNRYQLAQLLCCQSDQPIHLALILSYIYTRLRPYVIESNVAAEMEAHSKEFAKMATDILDCSYKDQTCRTYYVLSEENPNWLGKTTVDIAATAKNKTFLAHPCCQRWLTNVFLGNLSIRDLPWGIFTVPICLKVLLCAFFVFPMYMWVRFKSDPHRSAHWEEDPENDSDEDQEPAIQPPSQNVKMVSEDSGSFHSQQSRDVFPGSFHQKKRHSRRHEQIFVYSPPPLWKMITMMWSAPITKFWAFQVFYVIYLAIFSLAVLWPSCGNSMLDLVVCGWTALLMLESIQRTYYIYSVSVQKFSSVPLFLKCIEVVLMVIFIYLYLVTRVFFPDTLLSPYQSKVLLCLALLYFYYRIIAIYLPISPTLGPLLYQVKLMVLVDFVNFMRMTLVVLLSGGIIIHAVTFPDYPITKEMLRRMFHKTWFSLFITPIEDLEGDKRCLGNESPSMDVCRVSSYEDFTCPNLGVWPYIFTINYLILIKLILLTLLYALFSTTAAEVDDRIDDIWKYQRYQLIVDFANSFHLPAPLNIFSYAVCLFRCCRKAKKESSIKVHRLTEKDYKYWRQLAQDFGKQQRAAANVSQTSCPQYKLIQSVMEDIDYHKRVLRQMQGHLRELERMMSSTQVYLENIRHLATKDRNTFQSPHQLSRHSPYPGTQVQRYPVPDKYVPWEVMWIDYDPVAYTRPRSDFPVSFQGDVDIDILLVREKQSGEAQLSLPVLMWNSVSVSPAGVSIDRQSWIMKEEGKNLVYKLDSESLPQNPMGRTGLRGRGALPRWGPNHYILVIVTRWQRSKVTFTGGYGLELVVLKDWRPDQFSLLGGFTPGEFRYEVVRALFKHESTGNTVWKSADQMNDFFKACSKTGEETEDKDVRCEKVMQGYMDDPWNTDQSWKETELWHIHYFTTDTLANHLLPQASWQVLTDEMFIKLPPGQAALLQEVTHRLQLSLT